MGVFSEAVNVACSAAGLPLRLEWRGHMYRLAAEPLRWYERRNWWAEEARAQNGRGAGLVDHEIWRVQARLTPQSDIRTFDLSHQVGTDRWRLIRIHDALRPLTA